MGSASVTTNDPSFIKFKDADDQGARLLEEWRVLHVLLRGAILSLADWLSWTYQKRTLVITCLHRTPEENKAVGGVPHSLHTRDRAADIRNWPYMSDNARILKAIKTWWVDNITLYDERLQIVIEKDHIHVEFDESADT